MRWVTFIACLGLAGCVNPWIDRINQLDADHQAGRVAEDDYAARRLWMLQQYQDSEIRTAERNQVFTSLSGGTTYTTYGRQTTVPMLQASVGRSYAAYRAPRRAQRAYPPKRERFVESRVRTPRPPTQRLPSERPRVRANQPLVIPPVPLQPPVQRKPPPSPPKRDPSVLIVER